MRQVREHEVARGRAAGDALKRDRTSPHGPAFTLTSNSGEPGMPREERWGRCRTPSRLVVDTNQPPSPVPCPTTARRPEACLHATHPEVATGKALRHFCPPTPSPSGSHAALFPVDFSVVSLGKCHFISVFLRFQTFGSREVTAPSVPLASHPQNPRPIPSATPAVHWHDGGIPHTLRRGLWVGQRCGWALGASTPVKPSSGKAIATLDHLMGPRPSSVQSNAPSNILQPPSPPPAKPVLMSAAALGD